MRLAPKTMAAVAMLALSSLDNVSAQVRARADISCKPAPQMLEYDCVIKLINPRTNEPLSGLTLMVGADMPSMAGAHNVRPVSATEDSDKGTYRARIALEMHGDWALQSLPWTQPRYVPNMRACKSAPRVAPPLVNCSSSGTPV